MQSAGADRPLRFDPDKGVEPGARYCDANIYPYRNSSDLTNKMETARTNGAYGRMSDRRTEERASIKRFETARDAVNDHLAKLMDFHTRGQVDQRNTALDSFEPLMDEYSNAAKALKDLLTKRMQKRA